MYKRQAIELLLFQNKQDEALVQIDTMRSKFTFHNLTDELLFLEADIYLKQGKFSQSIELLAEIVEVYGTDILGDDAYFMMGDIYENQLGDKEKAMEIYIDFLTKYPGSVYSAESRKRYRSLRGDFEFQEEDSSF